MKAASRRPLTTVPTICELSVNNASWDRDEYAQNLLRNRGLDTASMLRSIGLTPD